MANLYLCNSGEQGNNGTEYVRYDASTKYIQAMKENGTWQNIYYATALPLKDYVYAYKIETGWSRAGDSFSYGMTITQYNTNGSSISTTMNPSEIYSEDNVRLARGGSYTYGHLKITKPYDHHAGNIICTTPYYVTDSSFWNSNATYHTANSIVIVVEWSSDFTIYIRTTAIAS